MLFNSIEFLALFLPAVLLVFLLLQRWHRSRWAIAWLTVSSLFFYAWWNPVYLVLILLSMAVNFTLGKAMSDRPDRQSHTLLVIGIAFNLGLLSYFKYFNFFVDNLNLLVSTSFNFQTIILPLAISFYTFQQITYLVDSRKGLTESHGLLEYGLFVTFFPQLIAGPIVHHSEILNQLKAMGRAPEAARNIAIGCSILAIGLFKKVVVADSFALFATPVFDMVAAGEVLHSVDVLAGIFAYAFQLYFDFSGYSDMAIGLACLFGVKLPVNFLSPYRARNIADFWRMWHATLSRFLRDYVYMPLGGFVCSRRRQRFNLFATMFAGGVWHGAGWTFVVYGLCHGVYVVVHQLWRVKVSGPLGLVRNHTYQFACQVFTFLVVVLTLVFFRADSLGAAGAVFAQLANLQGGSPSTMYLEQVATSDPVRLFQIMAIDWPAIEILYVFLAMALVVCWCLPNTQQLFAPYDVMSKIKSDGRKPVIELTWRANRRWALITAALLTLSLLNLTDVTEFLYFQF